MSNVDHICCKRWGFVIKGKQVPDPVVLCYSNSTLGITMMRMVGSHTTYAKSWQYESKLEISKLR